MAQVSKIVIDRDLCVGVAACVTIMPDVFQLDADNKAVIVPDSKSKWADVETVLLAAKSCPTKAIFVYDEKGSQIYPK